MSHCPAIGTGGSHSDSWWDPDGGACQWCGAWSPTRHADAAGIEAARLRPSVDRDRLLERRARAIEAAAEAGIEPPLPGARTLSRAV